MSLIHYLTGDPFSEIRTIPTLFDKDIGHGIRFSDLIQPMLDHLRSSYIRPWRHIVDKHSGISEIQMDKENFKVVMDLQHFAPNEITVKTVEDQIIVEGKHEEKQDEHGFISRHFIRRYRLPRGANVDAVTSSLSSDGVLTVTAPRIPPLEGGKVITIPITMTETTSDSNKDENQ